MRAVSKAATSEAVRWNNSNQVRSGSQALCSIWPMKYVLGSLKAQPNDERSAAAAVMINRLGRRKGAMNDPEWQAERMMTVGTCGMGANNCWAYAASR